MFVRELAGWEVGLGAGRTGPGEPGAQGLSWVGTGFERGVETHGKAREPGCSQLLDLGEMGPGRGCAQGCGGWAWAARDTSEEAERAGLGRGRGHRMRGAGRGSTWQLGMGKGSGPPAAGQGGGLLA